MPTCRPAGTLGGGQDGSSEQIWAYIYIMWCGVGVFVGRVPNTVLEPNGLHTIVVSNVNAI